MIHFGVAACNHRVIEIFGGAVIIAVYAVLNFIAQMSGFEPRPLYLVASMVWTLLTASLIIVGTLLNKDNFLKICYNLYAR
mgnify:CR=1 FL=1